MVEQAISPARGYAIGLLTRVAFGPGIEEYLRRIDATLAPYQGRFLVHGGTANVVEGTAVGDVIVIEFPSIEAAYGWYQSDAYQSIVALRTDNANGTVLLVDGVGFQHLATDVLPAQPQRSPRR